MKNIHGSFGPVIYFHVPKLKSFKEGVAMCNKNILYLTRTMGLGGTEKVILQLCEGLKDDFNKIVVASRGGLHEDVLNKSGITHYKISDFENKNPIVILKTIIELIKIIKSEDIDIVHSHHRMGTFYTNIVAKLIKVKVVHTAHNTFNDKKIFTKLALKNVEIIAVGEKVKENLVDFYKIKNSNIKVIYNGIKQEKNTCPKAIEELLTLKQNGFYIVGNIGRLSKQKGMEYFIKSIPQIIEKEHKIRFVIVGDGELREELECLTKKINIEDSIIFLGYRDDIINVINHLDLVVLSSLWEGLPLTPIETFMQGKTIVATDVDGTGEIVENGFNGILINSRSENEIAEAVLRLYRNDGMKKQMEKRALETYINKFTYERFIDQYRNFYNDLIK